MNSGSFCSNFSLAAVNCSPFVGHLRDPSHAKMAFLYSSGRHIESKRNDKISEMICTIGELLAPQLLQERTLGKTEAEKKFVKTVLTLLASEKLKNLTLLDTQTWQEESSNGILKNRKFEGDKSNFWPKTIPAKNPFFDEKKKNLLDKELAMDILTVMTIKAKNLKNEIIYCLLGMHGLISNGECHISNEVFKKFGLNMDQKFLEKLSKSVYEEYKNDLTPEVAQEINLFWDSWIPPRMQEMKPPVKNVNSKVNLIKNSILSYPDFPWEKLAQDKTVYEELEDFSKFISGECTLRKCEMISKIAGVLLGKKEVDELPQKVASLLKEYYEGKELDVDIPEKVKKVLKNIRRFSGMESSQNDSFIEEMNKRIELIKIGSDSKNRWFSIRY